VSSLVRLFPDISVILIDNYSQDESSSYCERVAKKISTITLMQLERNVGHGPAINKAIRNVGTRFFFTLDSDCEVKKRGFLRPMLDKFDNPNLYAIGWLRWVNELGVSVVPNCVNDKVKHNFTPYIHPYAALFDRKKYLTLPPFDYHGAPCMHNMMGARQKGYVVKDFPVQQYIKHLGAGTRRMWEGAWDVRDRPKKRKWRANDNYPL